MRWMSRAHAGVCCEPKARAGVQSEEQTFCSQAARTPKGIGRASLRSWLYCGDANALTSGLLSDVVSEWIWPMRASHESALSIGLGEMRTLVRSSALELSHACIRSTICTSWSSPTEMSSERANARKTRTQRKYWASVEGVKSRSDAS